MLSAALPGAFGSRGLIVATGAHVLMQVVMVLVLVAVAVSDRFSALTH